MATDDSKVSDCFKQEFSVLSGSEDAYEKIENDVIGLKETVAGEDLNERYVDHFMTVEQKKRDAKVTELFIAYVKNYKDKAESNKDYKNTLFGACILILLSYSVSLLFLILNYHDDNIAKLISICVTFLGMIIGMLKIIVRYIFPENEEQYITKIVEDIQKNDLKNKRENIKNENQKSKD